MTPDLKLEGDDARVQRIVRDIMGAFALESRTQPCFARLVDVEEVVRFVLLRADAQRDTTALIPLNEAQEREAKAWAADDRLWTTQETVEFNLRTFARLVLKYATQIQGVDAQRDDPA